MQSGRLQRRDFLRLNGLALLGGLALVLPEPLTALSATPPTRAGAADVPLADLEPPVFLPNGETFKTWNPVLEFSRTYYVDASSPAASDANPGTQERPFKTIQRAAWLLQPGERVVVAEGIYRGTIRPARGGSSPRKMISYQAAPGAKVVVRGSQLLRMKWEPSEQMPGAWQARWPAGSFRQYQPFHLVNFNEAQARRMSWIELLKEMPATRLMRGLIFQDGQRMRQLLPEQAGQAGPGDYWLGEGGDVLHLVPFNGVDPAQAVFEFTTCESLFYPEKVGIGFIHVQGLTFEHAANGFPWPQMGAFSTVRGHNWLIEDNTIRQVNSIGMDIGIQDWELHQPQTTPGAHIVRRNTITDCGVGCLQAMEGRDDLIEDNLMQETSFHPVEQYWETAGIKFHRAVNSLVRRNRILNSIHAPGIWLDYENKNSRLTQNLILGCTTVTGAIVIEASSVANLVDHNFIWNTSGNGFYELDCSGQWICHNFIGNSSAWAVYLAGKVTERIVHGKTAAAGGHILANNIFCNNHATVFSNAQQKSQDNNVEQGVEAKFDQEGLQITWQVKARLRRGEAIPGVTHDYFDQPRPPGNQYPGLFVRIPARKTRISLWRAPGN